MAASGFAALFIIRDSHAERAGYDDGFSGRDPMLVSGGFRGDRAYEEAYEEGKRARAASISSYQGVEAYDAESW